MARRKLIPEPNYRLDGHGNPVPTGPTPDPITLRCQHCGDTRPNHTPSGAFCKAPSARSEGRSFTPWTRAEYDAAAAQAKAQAEARNAPERELHALRMFRAEHPYAPWGLALLKSDSRILEITSYPFIKPSADVSTRVHVMARTMIGDATSNTELNVADILPWPEAERGNPQTYRTAFMHGWACALDAVQNARTERLK